MKYVIIGFLLMGCNEHKCECPKYPGYEYKVVEKPTWKEHNGDIYIYENGIWWKSEDYEEFYL